MKKRHIWICVTLWLLIPAPMLVSSLGQVPGIGDAVKTVDIAREKDVVWLSLATCVAAIVYSAWLNFRKDALTEKITVALTESAKGSLSLANAIDDLRDEMRTGQRKQ